MRTTLNLDDQLLGMAEEYTGLHEKSALVREALTALVQREAARRLARLGGSAPDLTLAPRRRLDPVAPRRRLDPLAPRRRPDPVAPRRRPDHG